MLLKPKLHLIDGAAQDTPIVVNTNVSQSIDEPQLTEIEHKVQLIKQYIEANASPLTTEIVLEACVAMALKNLNYQIVKSKVLAFHDLLMIAEFQAQASQIKSLLCSPLLTRITPQGSSRQAGPFRKTNATSEQEHL